MEAWTEQLHSRACGGSGSSACPAPAGAAGAGAVDLTTVAARPPPAGCPPMQVGARAQQQAQDAVRHAGLPAARDGGGQLPRRGGGCVEPGACVGRGAGCGRVQGAGLERLVGTAGQRVSASQGEECVWAGWGGGGKPGGEAGSAWYEAGGKVALVRSVGWAAFRGAIDPSRFLPSPIAAGSPACLLPARPPAAAGQGPQGAAAAGAGAAAPVDRGQRRPRGAGAADVARCSGGRAGCRKPHHIR